MKKTLLHLSLAATILASQATAAVVVTPTSVSDDFESYTVGNNFQSSTADWGAVGNQMQVAAASDFSIAGDGSGNIIDAGAATSYAVYTGTTSGTFSIGAGELFVAEVLVAYTNTSFWGGLWIGNPSGTVYDSIQLGNTGFGASNTGGVALRNWHFDTSGSVTSSNSSFSTNVDTWYRLSVSGQQGSSTVSVDVYDTAADAFIAQDISLTLGTAIVDGARVGFGTEFSGAFKFDNFSTTIVPEPTTSALLGSMAMLALLRRRRK